MKTRPLVIGAALAAGAMFSAPAPASADDIFTEVFSAIGITSKPKEPIDYRERAPLVVPPKSALPTPQAPAETRAANWPNDPDVVARRKAAEDARLPALQIWQREEPRLSPGALRNGPRTATNNPAPPRWRHEDDTTDLIITPTMQMKDADNRRATSLSNLRPGEEPQRDSLTDPPAGYRKPTEIVRTQRAPSSTVNDRNENLGRDYVQQQRRRSDN
ncbi:MAG: hypothetical protein BGP06_16825 [Rhizobiales bacterium 65-9]|nr:hypothetical protein [Hyphomicrobiales bacterium]OJY38104.1 MAG: hypothetical protein BGP06_16825 [Rhizobiales bacterium 65-9]